MFAIRTQTSATIRLWYGKTERVSRNCKKGNPLLKTKRAYEPAESSDGARFLVDRLWPRGIKKENLKMEGWLKDMAPSPELRKWFAHDPDKWHEFQKRYRAELKANPDAWQPILEAAKQGNVTLLYSARDTEHNSAVLLKAFLEEQIKK
jgi:uncharacterized protein YeaO (DUF488 family)